MTARQRATLLALPTVCVLAVIVIFPTLFSLNVSLRAYDIRIPLQHAFNGLGNWITLLRNPDFYQSLLVTGTMGAGELILELSLGLLLALVLFQLPRARKIFQPILLIPMMVMPVVVGYIGRLVFEIRSGPVNYVITVLGMHALQWHASPSLALATITILRVWCWTPFVMATLLAGLLSLPMEPYESAQVDGASAWTTFFRITLPMMRTVIMLVIIMRLLEILQSFDIIYVLTLGGPGNRTMSLSLFTYLIGFRYWDVGQAAAAAWLLMVPLSLLLPVFVRVMQKGQTDEQAK
jgi:multiple sugar transport system permease protein